MKHILLCAALALAPLATQASTMPDIDKPAPDFTGTTADGKTLHLSDFKGRIVVLEWTNKDCPFVHKYYDSGAMQTLQKGATEQGVEWISVISSAPGKQGYVTGDQALAVAAERGANPNAIVLDPTGAIGHLYGAKTTPDMVVISQNGVLVYEGAIDDKPSADPSDIGGAHNYVTAALQSLRQGKAIETPMTEPYGCSIKY
jgi:hypothetical protein